MSYIKLQINIIDQCSIQKIKNIIFVFIRNKIVDI